MAVKRIKYKKDGNRFTNTTPIYNANNDKLHVEYELETFTFKIVNPKTNHVFKGGDGVNNYQTLLRHIRKRLKIMGVNLESEIRSV